MDTDKKQPDTRKCGDEKAGNRKTLGGPFLGGHDSISPIGWQETGTRLYQELV
jgi:hypothetical protein